MFLSDQHGMDVFDVARSEAHGGSSGVVACHRGDYRILNRVHELLRREELAGLSSENARKRFASNPLPIGKYPPGVYIPIVSENWMFSDEPAPDAGALLAWTYYDEIVPKPRARRFQSEVLCH